MNFPLRITVPELDEAESIIRDLCGELIEPGLRLDAHERATLARINRNLLADEGERVLEGDG